MSSLFERHCERDLVRYLDGELSARRVRKVDRHLESCGQCRAELEELKGTLAECARYRQNVLVAQSPEAPQRWRDLYRDFSRIDESLATDSLLVRLMRPLVHSGVPRWSFVGGLAALIVLGSLYQLRQAPSVQAASILRKAVAVSQSKPRVAHRIRVRTSHQQEFTRPAGVQAALLQVAEAQAVGSLFQAAHYDWNDPLSARAFQQWRDGQVQKTDQVSTVSNPQVPSESFTQIRTVAAQGELEAATLTLNPQDYPVEERLEFRDREWVELSEIAEASTESAGNAVAKNVEVPVRAAEIPSRPAAFAPGPPASISDEIEVLSVLSAIEADLGDPVEVSLSNGNVKVVGGEGISLRRQNQIRESLAPLPHVEVEFAPSVTAASLPETVVATGGSMAGVAPSAMQARLEKQLGSHTEFDRFSTHLLDLDEAAMQRVYAVRRLAQKFPAGDESQLGSKDLNVVHEIARKHTDMLAERLSEMERTLVPTLTALGGTLAGVRTTAIHGNWQPAAEDVYQHARRVEVLVSQLLGMTPGAGSVSGLPSELLIALKDLRGDLEDCRKFLPVR